MPAAIQWLNPSRTPPISRQQRSNIFVWDEQTGIKTLKAELISFPAATVRPFQCEQNALDVVIATELERSVYRTQFIVFFCKVEARKFVHTPFLEYFGL